MNKQISFATSPSTTLSDQPLSVVVVQIQKELDVLQAELAQGGAVESARRIAYIARQVLTVGEGQRGELSRLSQPQQTLLLRCLNIVPDTRLVDSNENREHQDGVTIWDYAIEVCRRVKVSTMKWDALKLTRISVDKGSTIRRIFVWQPSADVPMVILGGYRPKGSQHQADSWMERMAPVVELLKQDQVAYNAAVEDQKRWYAVHVPAPEAIKETALPEALPVAAIERGDVIDHLSWQQLTRLDTLRSVIDRISEVQLTALADHFVTQSFAVHTVFVSLVLQVRATPVEATLRLKVGREWILRPDFSFLTVETPVVCALLTCVVPLLKTDEDLEVYAKACFRIHEGYRLPQEAVAVGGMLVDKFIQGNVQNKLKLMNRFLGYIQAMALDAWAIDLMCYTVLVKTVVSSDKAFQTARSHRQDLLARCWFYNPENVKVLFMTASASQEAEIVADIGHLLEQPSLSPGQRRPEEALNDITALIMMWREARSQKATSACMGHLMSWLMVWRDSHEGLPLERHTALFILGFAMRPNMIQVALFKPILEECLGALNHIAQEKSLSFSARHLVVDALFTICSRPETEFLAENALYILAHLPTLQRLIVGFSDEDLMDFMGDIDRIPKNAPVEKSVLWGLVLLGFGTQCKLPDSYERIALKIRCYDRSFRYMHLFKMVAHVVSLDVPEVLHAVKTSYIRRVIDGDRWLIFSIIRNAMLDNVKPTDRPTCLSLVAFMAFYGRVTQVTPAPYPVAWELCNETLAAHERDFLTGRSLLEAPQRVLAQGGTATTFLDCLLPRAEVPEVLYGQGSLVDRLFYGVEMFIGYVWRQAAGRPVPPSERTGHEYNNDVEIAILILQRRAVDIPQAIKGRWNGLLEQVLPNSTPEQQALGFRLLAALNGASAWPECIQPSLLDFLVSHFLEIGTALKSLQSDVAGRDLYGISHIFAARSAHDSFKMSLGELLLLSDFLKAPNQEPILIPKFQHQPDQPKFDPQHPVEASEAPLPLLKVSEVTNLDSLDGWIKAIRTWAQRNKQKWERFA